MEKCSRTPKIDPKTLKEGWDVKKKVLELSQTLDSPAGSKPPNEQVKKIAQDILSKEGMSKEVGMSWLLKKKVFGKMAPSDAFELAADRLQAHDPANLERILKAAQRQSPFHTELGFHKTRSGETLGHIAARLDMPEMLIKIGKLNPQYLRQKDDFGDTPLHTASRYLSLRTIRAAIKNFPSLFALRNDKGLKPRDLEAGTYIRKKITEEEVISAHNKEKNTYQSALTTLRNACKEKKVKRFFTKTPTKGRKKPFIKDLSK